MKKKLQLQDTTTVHLLAGQTFHAELSYYAALCLMSMSTHAIWRCGTELKPRLYLQISETVPRRCKSSRHTLSGAMQRSRGDPGHLRLGWIASQNGALQLIVGPQASRPDDALTSTPL